jgi:molybdate transport system substrate-binding protein
MHRLSRRSLLAGLIVLSFATRAAEPAKPELLVFAAASLTNVLQDIGAAYTKETGQAVKFSFASSAILARQIEAGARADVFFSADLEWMDYLDARSLINHSTRVDVLSNRLALVAPADSTLDLKIAPNFPLAAALGKGRLATGDPDYVPVGRYAKSALMTLGIWNEIADRIVRADNVRSALAFVARGEAPLGIVYETDAKVDKNVRIVDLFPASSHPPITYPVATTAAAKSGAHGFAEYLRGPTARGIFQHYGFITLP